MKRYRISNCDGHADMEYSPKMGEFVICVQEFAADHLSNSKSVWAVPYDTFGNLLQTCKRTISLED